MEEGEQDLEKLTRWLDTIQTRDFFSAEDRQFVIGGGTPGSPAAAPPGGTPRSTSSTATASP